jgi:hypothetical protein
MRIEGTGGLGWREPSPCSMCGQHITREDHRLVRVILDGRAEQVFHPDCLEVFTEGLNLFVGLAVRTGVTPRFN